jgi:hypothetical protein
MGIELKLLGKWSAMQASRGAQCTCTNDHACKIVLWQTWPPVIFAVFMTGNKTVYEKHCRYLWVVYVGYDS